MGQMDEGEMVSSWLLQDISRPLLIHQGGGGGVVSADPLLACCLLLEVMVDLWIGVKQKEEHSSL